MNNNELKKLEDYLYKREFLIREARESFFAFCKLLHGYKDSWTHIKTLCDTLQKFYENELLNDAGKPFDKLMINMPPRHYKTRTLILFSAWILGKNKLNTIISTSYSDDLATEFSRYTRDIIQQEKKLDIDIVYTDIFPKSTIKDGNSSYSKWSLEGCHFNYLGAGFGASITGKGGNLLIVDDEIKSYEEACNEVQLEKKWEWYKNTFLSRLEEHGKQIICMTRWSERDICGKIIADEIENPQWYKLVFEAYDKDNDKMLCPDMLSKESYDDKKRLMDDDIFMSNFHQITVEKKGRLYQQFKEYEKLPMNESGQILSTGRLCFVDVADQGNDYLCAIFADEYKKDIFITDVLYTRSPQEITEKALCEKLIKNNTKHCLIESNAGGRAFARKVEYLLNNEYDRHNINIRWFTQTHNKLSRILTNASNVEERIYYPINWSFKFPEYSRAIKSFMRDKNNKNDDAPDALTGLLEMVVNNAGRVIREPSFRASELGL